MLGYPAEKKTHLAALAWLSRRLLNKEIRSQLFSAENREQITKLLKG